MVCKNCGAEIPDESKFCSVCGQKTEEESEIDKETEIVKKEIQNKKSNIFCPKCRSADLEVTTETNTQTTGGGYSAGKGCLGALMFGPLGALCGACGSQQTIKQESKTYFVCKKCGHKFRLIEDELKELDLELKILNAQKKGYIITGIVLAVLITIIDYSICDGEYELFVIMAIIFYVIIAAICVTFWKLADKKEMQIGTKISELKKQQKENIKIKDEEN